MLNQITEGWEKRASAAPTAPNKDIERAFADQCYALVANAAGPLMDEKFRLGFEIVSTNPDKTRMLGVFAFRVGKEIIYAPVFFDNGEVKGGDIMYRHATKRFLTLTPAVARFLVSLFRSGEGGSVPTSHALKQPQGINTQKVIFPPPMHKRAGIEGGVPEEVLQEMQRAATLERGLLGAYLEDTGYASLEKLASLCAINPRFADVVDTQLSREYMEEGKTFRIDNLTGELRELYPDTDSTLLDKLAYALHFGDEAEAGKLHRLVEEDYKLTLHTGITAAAKSASADSAPSPFVLDDQREGLQSPIIVADSCLESLRVGVFFVIDEKGDRRRAVVGLEGNISSDFKGCGTPYEHAGSGINPDRFVVVSEDGYYARIRGADKYLVEPALDTPSKLEEFGEDLPKKGKYYMTMDVQAGTIDTAVFRVASLTNDEPKRMKIEFRDEDAVNRWGQSRSVLVNLDSRRSSEESWGSNIRYLEVKRQELDDSECCGSANYAAKTFKVPANTDIDSIIRQNGYKKVSLRHDADTDTSVLWIDGRYREATKMAMAVHLSRDAGIPAADVMRLIEQPSVDFHFYAGEKSAYASRVMDAPDWQVHQDATFGIDFITPQSFNLRTTKYTPVNPPDHVGDHANLNGPVKNTDHLPDEAVQTASSEELGALSEGMGLPHTFDHGAVAALASSHNSMKVVSKYLAKIEEGIDALCRILFLARWKPEDFKKAYGDDDLEEHVTELESLVEQLGDFWCKMQARNPVKDPEHAPLNL